MGIKSDPNDILNRPPIAFNEPRAAPTVNYSSATLTQSATASLTAISIQGPGVITHMSLYVGANQRGTVKMLIDQQTTMSASYSSIISGPVYSSGVHMIGDFQQVATWPFSIIRYDAVPFESNFTLMYEFPNHSANYDVVIYYAYRLTE
jgi:hypothetical protein